MKILKLILLSIVILLNVSVAAGCKESGKSPIIIESLEHFLLQPIEKIKHHYSSQMEPVLIPREEDAVPGWKFTTTNNHSFLILTENNIVVSIIIEDAVFKTEKGIGVGNILSEVLEVYPDAKFYGGIPGYELVTVHIDNGRLIFRFDTQSIPMEKILKGDISKYDKTISDIPIRRISLRGIKNE